MIADFAGARVTVMGLGRFGGGAGAARWLADRGAEVLITDLASEERLATSLARLRDLLSTGRVRLRLGGHEPADFEYADLVVVNPAVPQPWADPFLHRARTRGVPITTEIRLVTERLDRRRTIGVTGTAGKSTVTAMIHHILSHDRLADRPHPGLGRAYIGGNFGGSLLAQLASIGADDWIVLELSSAMLYWLGEGVGSAPGAPCGFSPHVAVLTNLSPNHLDWHGTFEHYQRCKLGIFAWQQDGDHRVRRDRPPRRPLPLAIPGEHNQLNGEAAIAAVAAATGMPREEAIHRVRDFGGLPHRLQQIASKDGRVFYNDSKSTTPQATVVAVRSFPRPSSLHLIAGGYDKKIDLAPIVELTADLRGFYTIGETGPHLARTAHRAARAVFCETLENAVACALSRMGDDDILLLSPGCASWDQFTNYEERGEAFARSVHSLHASPLR
jgi:UDP-N-acetylmuramoylalanine--D-glutamate ligase